MSVSDAVETGRDRAALTREAGIGKLSFISVLAGVLVAYGAFAVLAALAAAISRPRTTAPSPPRPAKLTTVIWPNVTGRMVAERPGSIGTAHGPDSRPDAAVGKVIGSNRTSG